MNRLSARHLGEIDNNSKTDKRSIECCNSAGCDRGKTQQKRTSICSGVGHGLLCAYTFVMMRVVLLVVGTVAFLLATAGATDTRLSHCVKSVRSAVSETRRRWRLTIGEQRIIGANY